MRNKIVPAISALLGGFLGAGLTLATVEWTPDEKLAQINRAKALAEFVEAVGSDDRLLYDRKARALMVYASPEVIRYQAEWVQQHCNDTDTSKTPECQRAWARMVAAMRQDSGVLPAKRQHIINAIWEN